VSPLVEITRVFPAIAIIYASCSALSRTSPYVCTEPDGQRPACLSNWKSAEGVRRRKTTDEVPDVHSVHRAGRDRVHLSMSKRLLLGQIKAKLLPPRPFRTRECALSARDLSTLGGSTFGNVGFLRRIELNGKADMSGGLTLPKRHSVGYCLHEGRSQRNRLVDNRTRTSIYAP
jgi:hypothetical protein